MFRIAVLTLCGQRKRLFILCKLDGIDLSFSWHAVAGDLNLCLNFLSILGFWAALQLFMFFEDFFDFLFKLIFAFNLKVA